MTLSTVRCRILGQAEIHTKGIRISPESDLQFGLALYFCTQAGREIPRDELARLFWPTHTMEAGRHCLRQAIYRLRVLGVAVRNGARTAILDAHFVEADFASMMSDGTPSGVFLQLTDVTVLPGYAPQFSRPFARWLEDFRVELGGRMRRGLVRAISEMRARGRYGDVERLCRFCLQLDPLNEEATLALAESVALAGGKAEAVGLIDRYAGEIGRYQPELRVPASLLRERISDRLIRRSQAAVELPMVGREQDVERVMSAIQRLRGNRAVSYVITGVAGVGKSRLAYECCRMAELQGARLLTIGTQPSSRTQALFAVSELVDGLLQMPGAIGCAPAALDCLKAMSSPMPIREPNLPLNAGGEALFAMVRWSILDVLDAILLEGPLVIHVDDAHQLDAQSQAIMLDALRTHALRPLLLLFTMRQPELLDADRFNRMTNASSLHELSPLSDKSCDQLIQRFCAAHEETLDERSRDRIIQLACGNPLFLVELLKHRSELVTDDLPVTIQALLDDRLRRLSATAATVLRAIAVLGLSSNVERVQRVVQRKTNDVLDALSELHTAGFLSAGSTGTTCRHDSIRDAVLDRTPVAGRLLLHRRAARTLGKEAILSGGVALLWECVHHWKSAGTTRNGLRLALFLAKRLQNLGLAQDSLDLLDDIETKVEDRTEKLQTFKGQAHAARTMRNWLRVKDSVSKWREAQKAVIPPPPIHSTIELLAFEAHYNSNETYGSLPDAIEHCIQSASASVAHRLSAATLAMIRADNEGRSDLAQSVFDCISVLRPRTRSERIAWITSAAVYHSSFGVLSEVPNLLGELLELAQGVKQPALRAHLVRRACFGIARFGSAEVAAYQLRECLKVFERLRLPAQQVYCIEELGLLSLRLGRTAEAKDWIRSVAAIGSQFQLPLAKAVEFEIRVLLAFYTDDKLELPCFAMPPEATDSLGRTRRGRQSVLSLHVLNEVLADRPLNRGVLSELQELYEELKNRSYQDDVVGALVIGLRHSSDSRGAEDLLEQYIARHRRELSEVPSSLHRLRRLVQIEDDLQFADAYEEQRDVRAS